jgi:hypothetical protein
MPLTRNIMLSRSRVPSLCYVSMARVAQLERVLDDGYLSVRISSEL